jgi:uncharacterized protein (TIGR00251 family)
MFKIQTTTDGAMFTIRVQPRAAKTMIVGLHGDALKVKLTAPPVDNAANNMCIAVLAKALKVPKSAVRIVSGHTLRTKRILVQRPANLSPEELKQRLLSIAKS